MARGFFNQVVNLQTHIPEYEASRRSNTRYLNLALMSQLQLESVHRLTVDFAGFPRPLHGKAKEFFRSD